jgi:hypothetical protein
MWKKTKPPKRTQKPVTIHFRCRISNRVNQGQFVWFARENAFTMVTNEQDPDGLALYDEDYEILGWK